MSSINFDNVWLLLIAVPLVLAFAVAFCIAINKDNRNFHNVASSVLHVLIAILVAFSAAGTSIETVVTETDVYVVADVSYSSNRNLDTIDEYIDELQDHLPRNSRLGIVCFGLDQQVITPAGQEIQSVKTAEVDDSGTDIVSALSFVGKIFRADVKKRVVLITDGKQTDESDPSALRRVVSELNHDNIVVDAIYLDNNVKLGESEAQVTSVDYAETVYKNREAQATVQINSRLHTKANVSLWKDGEEVEVEPITLKTGRNYVTFALPTTTEGVYDYEIRLQAEEDRNPHDNVQYFTQTVLSSVKVLLVTGLRSDGAALAEAMGENAQITTYLLNETTRYTGPYTVSNLCQYDEIVLSNVNLALMDYCDMFVDSVLSVVNDLGKSLVTMGNLYMRPDEVQSGEEVVQNSAQSALARLAEKLPVDYMNSARDKKLITFVFDESDSMFNNGRLLRAQTAAKEIINSSIVTEEDSVAIVSFNGNKATELGVTKLTEKGREEALEAIDGLSVKHGTMISGGLEQTYIDIAALNEYERQVILMSDGMNSAADPDADVYAWADALGSTPGIAVSVLDVGRGAGDKWDESWVEASNRLKEIARLGKGKYMLADTDSTLKNFILPEITNDVGDAIVDGQQTKLNVEINKAEVLEGLDTDALPTISGYINTGLRHSAKNVLTVDHKLTGNRTMKVPVYAYWTMGKGKISSFTSNITDNPSGGNIGQEYYWLSKWYEGNTAKTFFKNVLTSSTPTERNDNPFSVSLNAQTGYCGLTIAPVEVKNGATVDIRVVLPDETEIAVNNTVFDSSVYTASFSTLMQGKYKITVDYSYNGIVNTYSTYTDVSYLPEYDSFALFEPGPLYTMLSESGTVSEDGKLTIEHDENEVDKRIVRLEIPLLIAAVALFVADIVIRKLKWSDIRSLFTKVNKEGKA